MVIFVSIFSISTPIDSQTFPVAIESRWSFTGGGAEALGTHGLGIFEGFFPMELPFSKK